MRIFFCFVIVIAISGCAKKAPEGLPPLLPCTVRVVDGDQPIAGIGVSFQRFEGHAGWSINGMTQSNGRAGVRTIAASFEADGLPAGTYRITLEERIELPPELIDDRDPTMLAKQRKYLDERRLLPKILCDPSTSPLEIIVTKNMSETMIDVSKYR